MKIKGKLTEMGKKNKDNPIAYEVEVYEKQIKEIQDSLKSVVLVSIADEEARLKSTKTKLECMDKLGSVLLQLKELRKTRDEELSQADTKEVRGDVDLSPHEQGLI